MSTARRLAILLTLLVFVAGAAHASGRRQALPDGQLQEFAAGNPVDLAWYHPPDRPHFWATDDRILVLDAAAGTVSSYTADGQLKGSFGSTGTRPGQLMNPQGLAVDWQGQVWVADTGNDRIQVFDSAGGLVRSFGRSGSAPGEFNDPRGIHFARLSGESDDLLVVADTANDRLQAFTLEGVFKAQAGLPRPLALTTARGGAVVVASGQTATLQSAYRFDDVGPFQALQRSPVAESFQAPVDLARWNGLTVADSARREVIVFDDSPYRHRRTIEGFELAPRAVLNGRNPHTDSVYVADGRRVVEIRLVVDSPLPVFEAYRERLAAGDVEGALQYVYPTRRAGYRRMYTSISAGQLAKLAEGMQRVEPGELRDEKATLFIVTDVQLEGDTQPQPIHSRILFVRGPDGAWLIYEY